MKRINNLTLLMIILAAGLVTACGGGRELSIEELIASGDLEAIRSKKKELSTQQQALEASISKLDSAIGLGSENKNLPLVTALETKKEVFNHFIELQGDVTTKQNVLIYPEVAGTLIEVVVREGQSVSKDQVLAKVDDGGASNQLIQMQTQLALLKTTYERQKRLWEQNIGSEIQYLSAETNYLAQKNAVEQMESQLAKYTIRAPFSGIIDDVIKDQGVVVSPGPGSEIFRIVNLSNMYVEVPVPESYVATVTPGKNVKVHFPILNETVESKVRQTGNFINPDNRSFTAEVPVPNKGGRVKPNLTARVQINDYVNEAAIMIPQSIISENAEGDQYVYLIEGIQKDNTAIANKHIIQTGQTQGDYVEIVSGLDDNQFIIVEGARSVKDGQTVKMIK